jgi:hypothetical protein
LGVGLGALRIIPTTRCLIPYRDLMVHKDTSTVNYLYFIPAQLKACPPLPTRTFSPNPRRGKIWPT